MVNLGPLVALGMCVMVLGTLCYLAISMPSAQEEPELVEEREPESEFTIRYAHEIEEEALEHDQFAAAAITAAITRGCDPQAG